MKKIKELICEHCLQVFYPTNKQWKAKRFNKRKKGSPITCSHECRIGIKGHKPKQEVECKNCGKLFFKNGFRIKKYPNHFCGSSCAAKFNNANKKFGIKRSKLEKFLEEQLISIYPNLEFHFNQKDMINSELDIYIPSLKLAFELNGIFHYEPIFGEESLRRIKNNDERKFQACLERGIEFCTIDASSQKQFNNKTSLKYLDIIINIIDKKLDSFV